MICDSCKEGGNIAKDFDMQDPEVADLAVFQHAHCEGSGCMCQHRVNGIKVEVLKDPKDE